MSDKNYTNLAKTPLFPCFWVAGKLNFDSEVSRKRQNYLIYMMPCIK